MFKNKNIENKFKFVTIYAHKFFVAEKKYNGHDIPKL